MTLAARHQFWNAPRPMLSNGPYRTIPLGLGGRFLAMGGPFLAEGASANRLLTLKIPAIIFRLAAVPALVPFFNPWASPLSSDETALILQIDQNPTADELSDVDFIDTFFSGYFESPKGPKHDHSTTTVGLCEYLSHLSSHNEYDRPYLPGGQYADQTTKVLHDKFYCTSNAAPYTRPNYLQYYPVDPNGVWGTIRQQALNANAIRAAVAAYPFPPPIDAFPSYFLLHAQPDIAKLIAIPDSLDPDMLNYWITLSIMANYNAIVGDIESYEKKKAKEEKRRAMIKMISEAVAVIIVAIIAPAAIAAVVSAAKTAVDLYTESQQRQKAAKDLADSAKLFEKDAPAFSAQLNKTAQFVDEVTAIQTAAQPPSPEIQAAVAELPSSGGVSPLIPGGIAAAGLAAFLIFR